MGREMGRIKGGGERMGRIRRWGGGGGWGRMGGGGDEGTWGGMGGGERGALGNHQQIRTENAATTSRKGETWGDRGGGGHGTNHPFVTVPFAPVPRRSQTPPSQSPFVHRKPPHPRTPTATAACAAAEVPCGPRHSGSATGLARAVGVQGRGLPCTAMAHRAIARWCERRGDPHAGGRSATKGPPHPKDVTGASVEGPAVAQRPVGGGVGRTGAAAPPSAIGQNGPVGHDGVRVPPMFTPARHCQGRCHRVRMPRVTCGCADMFGC